MPTDRIWPELEPGTRLADRYEIVRRIGSGGYANVYLARDPVLRRDVALKVLHRERLGERGIARLRREATVAREVASPHLVEIYDLVVQEHTVFLVMEWIDGETLQDRIRRRGPLPVEEVLEIGGQVLVGLEALHEREIVHRDIKPSNILLDGDRAKLADLGLALHWPGDHTRITATEAVVGTAEYLAPEQILDRPVDARTDLYALGATLYEALTGHPPFREGTSLAKILARLQDGPSPVREDRPDVPRWLDQLILRLLERRPEDRYPSVDSLRRALSTRTTQWLVPRRRRIAGRLLILVALGFGLAVVLWSRMAPSGPEFSHVVSLGDGDGIQAVATDGTILWTREGILAEFVSFRRTPDGVVRLAGFFTDGQKTGKTDRRLRILDARTGELVRTVILPSDTPGGSSYFPDFSDTYGTDLVARDVDGDGAAEILVTFLHTYWPSYTVLYEPKVRRTRIVLLAAGHHRPAAVLDLDRDGERELLLHGYANRLGFNMGLAAVDLEPPVNRDLGRRLPPPAHTPDAELAGAPNPLLRWYALLPPDSCEGPAATACVRPREDRLEIPVEHDDPLFLDLHGFRIGTASALSPAERQRVRFRSYRELARAQTLRVTGPATEALAAAREGTKEARRAGAPLLTEWGARVQGMILAEQGRLEEARATFREIWEETESPENVAYDAGHALHLQGALEEAVGWYRRVFAIDPTNR
ncbi:MAG: protein kinase, partial [Thermoanaerobaculia bacterium]|nr:protein kinase [Thermoanaerobaculia bacterium]